MKQRLIARMLDHTQRRGTCTPTCLCEWDSGGRVPWGLSKIFVHDSLSFRRRWGHKFPSLMDERRLLFA